jgi:hypothetical protein
MLQEPSKSEIKNNDIQVKGNWIKPEIKLSAVNENTPGIFRNPRRHRSTYGS